MTDQVLSQGARSRFLGPVVGAGCGLAAIALLMFGAAPFGWRAGLWHFRTGFAVLEYAAYVGLAAALVSLIGLVLALAAGNRRGLALALAGLIVGGGLAYVPWSYWQAGQRGPRIHDITTDTDNPPGFAAVLPARQAEQANTVDYGGPGLAAQQKAAYPDVAPLLTALAPADAFQRALATATSLGWVIAAADPAAGRIEASQSSLWFHFTDDIVVRIAPRSDGQPGSRIDLRSVSRQGRSDFGVNAGRIRRFIAALRQQPGV